MDVRERTVNLLLERGVRFRLPAPFFVSLLGLNRLTVRSLKAGTILEISRIVVKHKLEEALFEHNHAFLHKAIVPMSECMALAALNHRLKIKLFRKLLCRYLLWCVPAKELINMFKLVLELNSVTDFMTITKFFSLQAVSLLAPNLGQQKKGR